MEQSEGRDSGIIPSILSTIELVEYSPKFLPVNELSEEVGKLLWERYWAQIEIEFPSPKTGGQWQLKSIGWVGHIPISKELSLVLTPKVPLKNLFRMYEYAYRLESFRFLPGLAWCSSLQEFYEELAIVLARKVLDRTRKGLYRAYMPEEDTLPFIRGQIDMREVVRRPWNEKLRCRYEEHSSDIDDNQILAWTLFHVARSGICTERVLPSVRKAFHVLQGAVQLQPVKAEECIRRLYNRLNQDYQPMHSLCRFFLEQAGPTYSTGEFGMLPFLVSMSHLYELFVAEWLKAHRSDRVNLVFQDRLDIGPAGRLQFKMDIVLYDDSTGKPICVIDAKYKDAATVDNSDIEQVVTYALAKGCQEAILVYPTPLEQEFNETIGPIKVRTLVFDLSDDLELSGERFKKKLVQSFGSRAGLPTTD